MLTKILAIAGKPGLYKFISRGNRMIVVETIDQQKKRTPALATDKIVALADISIYTDDDKEVPLAGVLENIKKEYNGEIVPLHHKKAEQQDIIDFFAKALPNYDADRVHVSDMRKVLQWYNILISNGLDDFSTDNDWEKDGKEGKKD